MTETEKRLKALEADAARRAAALDEPDKIDASDHEASVYKSLHDDLQHDGHRLYVLKGGRGSGKSSCIGLEIVSGIMKDTTGKNNAIVFRRTGNTLRESVFYQISWAIDQLDAKGLWKSNYSPLSFTYRPTGAMIVFRGLDDAGKIKSIRPKQGYFKYIWIEETSEIRGQNFLRSILQSVVRGGNSTVFFSYNPPISRSNWINLYVDQLDDTAFILHTSYLDMPSEWLGQDFIDEAERLKAVNPAAYEHEYLGQCINDGSEVFPNITAREISDEEISDLQYVYAGIDFGFSSDPAVYIRVAYDRKTETIYFIDEIYRKHCSNAELAEEIKARRYDRHEAYSAFTTLSNTLTGSYQKERIVCDSAEPKSIDDLKGQGLQAMPCKKYPGSVRYGIAWLQHRQLVMDQRRTPRAFKEFVNYEYEKDKDGDILADVPDRDNHTIDATRYALDALINSRKESA